MNRWLTGLLVALLIALGAPGSTGLAREKSGERLQPTGERVETQAGKELKLITFSILLEPGPAGLVHEIDAYVALPAKQAKGVRCFGFVTDHSESATTTVATICRSRNRNVTARATFQVDSYLVDATTLEPVQLLDTCQQRRTLKKKETPFICVVQNPDSPV